MTLTNKLLKTMVLMLVSITTFAQTVNKVPVLISDINIENKAIKKWKFPCMLEQDSVTCSIIYPREDGSCGGIMLLDFDVENDTIFTFYGGEPLTSTTYHGEKLVKRSIIPENSTEYIRIYKERDSCVIMPPKDLENVIHKDSIPAPINSRSSHVYKGNYLDMEVYFGYDQYILSENKQGWFLTFVKNKKVLGIRIFKYASMSNTFDVFLFPLINQLEEWGPPENFVSNMQLIKGSHLFWLGWSFYNYRYIQITDIDLSIVYKELFK